MSYESRLGRLEASFNAFQPEDDEMLLTTLLPQWNRDECNRPLVLVSNCNGSRMELGNPGESTSEFLDRCWPDAFKFRFDRAMEPMDID